MSLRALRTHAVYLFILAAAGVIGFSLYLVWDRTEALTAAQHEQAEMVALSADLREASDYLTNYIRRYVQLGDPSILEGYWTEVNETRTRERVVDALEAHGVPAEELALVEEAARLSNGLVIMEEMAIQFVEFGEMNGARQIVYGEDYDAEKAQIDAVLDRFDAAVRERTGATLASAEQEARTWFLVLILVISVVLLGATWGYRTFTVRFSDPLQQLRNAAEGIAAGRTDVTLSIDRKDAIGELADAFGNMVGAMQEQAGWMERLAGGDLTVEVQPRSPDDAVGRSLQGLRDSLRVLAAEIEGLAEAGREGRLDHRAELDRVSGTYRSFLEGINATMEATTAPLEEATQVLERVADRDLSARMTGSYRGDHDRIRQALNLAVANLDEALGEVSTAADQVASAAGQISGGSHALAEGATEQAGSLQEVSASLQQLASMTTQNASNTSEARKVSEGTRRVTDEGADSMRRLGDAMARIKASSDDTYRIVKTIDEIAFQTNLLALNAAVEAARAGDAGKGFAVVAEEVRNLAMRSAEAAKSTQELIEGAVRNAEEGVSLNERVTAQLDEIRTGVARVEGVMTEIADAGDQQRAGVDQITGAVEQMNGVTQNTAASAEESASAAEELSAQAGQLQGLVGRFRITSVPPGRSGSAPGNGRQQTARDSAAPGGRSAGGNRTPGSDRAAPSPRNRLAANGAGSGRTGATAAPPGGTEGGSGSHLIPFDEDALASF
jgi:methyl-accepting chemotaxis protein